MPKVRLIARLVSLRKVTSKLPTEPMRPLRLFRLLAKYSSFPIASTSNGWPICWRGPAGPGRPFGGMPPRPRTPMCSTCSSVISSLRIV